MNLVANFFVFRGGGAGIHFPHTPFSARLAGAKFGQGFPQIGFARFQT